MVPIRCLIYENGRTSADVYWNGRTVGTETGVRTGVQRKLYCDTTVQGAMITMTTKQN